MIRPEPIWKPIPGHEFYEASDDGQIRSVDRLIPLPNGFVRRHRGRVLRPATKKDGHQGVMLGQYAWGQVHRLVMAAFVGPCPDGMECRHLNGNPADNRLENLAWGTSAENKADTVRHGTVTRGERNGSSRLTEGVVLEMREMRRAGQTFPAIAARFGVPRATVMHAVTGYSWSHLPGAVSPTVCSRRAR